MTIHYAYDPQGGAVCHNPHGMTFYLAGQPPRPAPARPAPPAPTRPTFPAQTPRQGWGTAMARRLTRS